MSDDGVVHGGAGAAGPGPGPAGTVPPGFSATPSFGTVPPGFSATPSFGAGRPGSPGAPGARPPRPAARRRKRRLGPLLLVLLLVAGAGGVAYAVVQRGEDDAEAVDDTSPHGPLTDVVATGPGLTWRAPASELDATRTLAEQRDTSRLADVPYDSYTYGDDHRAYFVMVYPRSVAATEVDVELARTQFADARATIEGEGSTEIAGEPATRYELRFQHQQRDVRYLQASASVDGALVVVEGIAAEGREVEGDEFDRLVASIRRWTPKAKPSKPGIEPQAPAQAFLAWAKATVAGDVDGSCGPLVDRSFIQFGGAGERCPAEIQHAGALTGLPAGSADGPVEIAIRSEVIDGARAELTFQVGDQPVSEPVVMLQQRDGRWGLDLFASVGIDGAGPEGCFVENNYVRNQITLYEFTEDRPPNSDAELAAHGLDGSPWVTVGPGGTLTSTGDCA